MKNFAPIKVKNNDGLDLLELVSSHEILQAKLIDACIVIHTTYKDSDNYYDYLTAKAIKFCSPVPGTFVIFSNQA